MQFLKTDITGVVLVEIEPAVDERGFFARLHCPVEMDAAGFTFHPQQTSLSRNKAKSTLRGMHYTTEPEAKLVRCVRGHIYDVALDLRPRSKTFGKSTGWELDSDSAAALFIPAGVAHGFLTLEADSDVLYQIDRIYRPGFDAGVRWNDPSFNIEWPETPRVVHPRDLSYPNFVPT